MAILYSIYAMNICESQNFEWKSAKVIALLKHIMGPYLGWQFLKQ